MLYEALPDTGGTMAVNYGTNRVRFPRPVPSGSRDSRPFPDTRGRRRRDGDEGDDRGDRRVRRRREARLRGRTRRADSVLTTPGFVGQVCYLGPPVGLKRLSLLAALAAALSLGVVSDASAGSIADFDPCPKSGGDLVCPVGTTGTPYSIKFHGDEDPICAPGDDKWYVGSGAVPPGLTLAENGLLSGTPTQEGTYAFWLELKLPDYFNPGPPPSGCSSRDNSEEHVSITIVPGAPEADHRPGVHDSGNDGEAVLAPDDGDHRG